MGLIRVGQMLIGIFSYVGNGTSASLKSPGGKITVGLAAERISFSAVSTKIFFILPDEI